MAEVNRVCIEALCIHTAQENQKKYYDKSVRPRVFDIGAQVLISTEHLSLGIDVFPNTRKFREKFVGPYTILDRYNPKPYTDPNNNTYTVFSAYKLDLGRTTIHNVFHVNLLRLYNQDEDFEEVPPPLEDHPDYYAVERISTHRYRKHGAAKPRLELLVYWLGYDQPSWVPAPQVTQDLLDDYQDQINEKLPLFKSTKSR